MEFLFTLITLFGCSAVWLLPTALTAAAIVDMVRVRAEWYWCFIIFGIPFFGPLAYFAVNYLSIFGGNQAISSISPTAYRRTQSRRRLKELQIQLQHWRGPAVLAEAGEHLLSLGKMKHAEEMLREAKEAEADVKDVNFNLAQVLQVKGRRWREALPLLEELVDLAPDARFGAARLALARCLDEIGDTERAEDELRAVLEKRSPPEGKVRLARILLARGEGREASELLAEVRADAAAMPKYLVKEHKPWIRMARMLKAKDTRLPPPKLEGLPPKRSPAFLAALAFGGLVLIAGVVAFGRLYVLPFADAVGSFDDQAEVLDLQERNQSRLKALVRRVEARMDPDDPASVEATLPAFLSVRREVAPQCEPVLAAHNEQQQAMERMKDGAPITESFAMVRRISAWREAQVRFGSALVRSLKTHGLAPEDLDRLVALVDGALLGRPEARLFQLPEHFRSDYAIARSTVAEVIPADAEAAWRRDLESRKAEARAKLHDFEALATSKLTAETREVLEPHRPEFEASLPAGCLQGVIQTLEPELVWMSLPEPDHPSIEH